jgi:hypothetical protein
MEKMETAVINKTIMAQKTIPILKKVFRSERVMVNNNIKFGVLSPFTFSRLMI